MHDDDLIDHVAHAMTRGEPSAQVRRAVRLSIESGLADKGAPRVTPPSRTTWRGGQRVRSVWLVAAAAAIVLSVIVAQLLSGAREGLLPSTRIASVPSLTPPVALQPAPDVAVRAPVTPTPRRDRPSMAPRAIVVDPLVIEPIVVPLIAIDANAAVMPIDIQQLQIELLQPE